MNKGIQSLQAAVEHDCNDKDACGCFNPNGCDKGGRNGDKRCFHRYCDKFAWVVERARHYSEKLGIPFDEILGSWEEDRRYWYMNYYQDGNQPLIEGERVRVFETVDEMMAAVGKAGFRCPACGRVSTNPYECNAGCDWEVYGLFGDMGKGIFVYVKEKRKGETMFMPVAWEEVKKA